jgi:formylmethanofuran dehydrogenase subunit B
LLMVARRVLVTGLQEVNVEAVTAACDLAEACGAAIDPGDPDLDGPGGSTIGRAGSISAEFEELRDRADLVIYWFCDPSLTHPRFVERFVAPPLDGRPRRSIAIGPRGVVAPSPRHAHLPLPADAAVAAARSLQAHVEGLTPWPAPMVARADARDSEVPEDSDPIAEVVRRAMEAIESARCIALVSDAHADPRLDITGLRAWSRSALVRSLSHSRPAFEVPLGGATAAGAVCTWRYGSPGAIPRADRNGAAALPGEAAARPLVERGEVDCVLSVGPLPAALASGMAAASRPGSTTGPMLIEISDRAAAGPGGPLLRQPVVRIRCRSTLRHPAGTMVRGDGRWIALGTDADEGMVDEREPATAVSVEQVLRAILGLLKVPSQEAGR